MARVDTQLGLGLKANKNVEVASANAAPLLPSKLNVHLLLHHLTKTDPIFYCFI